MSTDSPTNSKSIRAELDEFLTDLLVTGVEGGINDWADIAAYQWDTKSPNDRYAIIHEVEEGEAHERPITIGLINLEKALQNPQAPAVLQRALALINAGHRWADLDESGQFDAADADALVQIAALGEITYG